VLLYFYYFYYFYYFLEGGIELVSLGKENEKIKKRAVVTLKEFVVGWIRRRGASRKEHKGGGCREKERAQERKGRVLVWVLLHI
jgi:hypothetical protein